MSTDSSRIGMTVELFERYRDALRRGHVAVARGHLDDAAEAYREAIALAPDRPVAHAGLATVHLARGNASAALTEADVALGRASRDESALGSRAEALGRLGRRIEAAEALDRLSDLQEAAGHRSDALATARRALALAEQKTRRRHVDALAALMAPVLAEAEAAREREPGPIADGGKLLADAEAACDANELGAARRLALAAADAFARSGHIPAAIDACSLALTVAPDDPDLHLLLVELYLDRGWRSHAAEKLALLGRLADLDQDAAARTRLCAIVGAEFADHPGLTALCA